MLWYPPPHPNPLRPQWRRGSVWQRPMNWVTGIVVYILVWWVSLFAILPLWVVPSEPGELGHAAGAPRRPLLARKLAVTSAVAAVIWVGIYIIVSEPWFSFRSS